MKNTDDYFYRTIDQLTNAIETYRLRFKDASDEEKDRVLKRIAWLSGEFDKAAAQE